MSGFIYLWYDRKHKRFYLGKHWGTEDDGYICSSTWMKRAYKRRPEDFGKKRILEWIHTSRDDLSEAEYRWGRLIKKEELGKRYYNLRLPGNKHWHDDPLSKRSVGQKISDTLQTPEIKAKRSQSIKEAFKDGFSDDHRRKLSDKKRGRPSNRRGIKSSDETKAKQSIIAKEQWKNGIHKPRSPTSESIAKGTATKRAKNSFYRPKGHIWITNGKETRSLPSADKSIPEGWWRGMTKKKKK